MNPKTNVVNLKRAKEFLESIPEDKIQMGYFRYGEDEVNPICGSSGCIVGLCTELDADNVLENHKDRFGYIKFMKWSHEFFGTSPDSNDSRWKFLFSQLHINDKRGHLNRLQYVIDNPNDPDPCKTSGHTRDDFGTVFEYPKEEEQNES